MFLILIRQIINKVFNIKSNFLIGFFSFALLFLVFNVTTIRAETTSEVTPIIITVLGRPDCQHCKDELAFLDSLKQVRSDFSVTYINVLEEDGKQIWSTLIEKEQLSQATPVTLIGSNLIQGFDHADTTGRRFIELLDQKPTSYSLEEFLQKGGSQALNTKGAETISNGLCDENTECAVTADPIYVSLPFFGVVNIKEYSLPMLAIILGFIDGFNPCAMWVLVTFLVILVQVGDRKKMWTFAGLFIIAEAIMYYLILTVWFTTWNFVKLDQFVTPLVGLLAIGSGFFFLYEWKNSDGSCEITSSDQKQKTRAKIKEIVAKPLTFVTALGIIGIALSVNIIEFACSIGIPQAFTKIVELNSPNWVTTNLYLFTYILFYMVDDFIVFGLALYSFEKIGLTSKYSRWSNLVGGCLMLLLGILLLFKPGWLLF